MYTQREHSLTDDVHSDRNVHVHPNARAGVNYCQLLMSLILLNCICCMRSLSAYDFHKSKESNPKWNVLVAACTYSTQTRRHNHSRRLLFVVPAMAALAFGTQMVF